MRKHKTQKPKHAVGPKLRQLLRVIFMFFGLLTINSVYLASITFLEWLTDKILQDQVYLYMFLGHLIVGLLLIVPVIIYGLIHLGNTRHRRNKRAIKAGYALFIASLVLLISGLLLTRGMPIIEIKNNQFRAMLYWLHVLLPMMVIWLFIMHRLAGFKLSWKPAQLTALCTVLVMGVMIFLQKDTLWPQSVQHQEMNPLFAPSFAQTNTNHYIEASDLDNNKYCQNCHQDIHKGWMNSVHKVSSFNNQSYAFAVNNTRDVLNQRDGNHEAARFCAACHDPVIMFSGEFDKDIDFTGTEIGQAGITCTSCHAITDVNSIKGNGAYTLSIPEQYPFTSSELPFLQWVNETLIKAKPDFHKASYLKPLHKTAGFCSTCHKVSIPKALNQYKWLRGQNHYDSFSLSGVSGHSVTSFYYPDQAKKNCTQCHMPLHNSDDFGAINNPVTEENEVHSHYFEAANSAIKYLNNLDSDPQHDMLEGALSIDIFGIRQGGLLNGELMAPLNNGDVSLQPGKSYLIESVIRTLTLGHAFTQGTTDSNQVWVSLNVYHDGKLMASNGGVDVNGNVDPWSYFINAYVVDDQGQRIDKRNVEDVFTALYNHNIPPGAAAVVHHALNIPEYLTGEITIEAQVHYRKFDSTYYRYFTEQENKFNDLPIRQLAIDKLTMAIDTDATDSTVSGEWKRWNDYGIALLRSNAFRQAEEAFKQVAELGLANGWINLTRTYLQQGQLEQASKALSQAANNDDLQYTWQLAYYAAVIDLQNGFIEKALANFSLVYQSAFKQAQQANFDFSKDYRFVTLYAQTVFQRSKMLSNEQQRLYQQKALRLFDEVLQLNPEWADAHFGLFQLYTAIGGKGNVAKALEHKALHQKYKVDDNVHDKVIAKARASSPAVDNAAEAIAIYPLNDFDQYMPVDQFIHKYSIRTQ